MTVKREPFRLVLFLVVCLSMTFAWCQSGFAQQQSDNSPAVNPLVRLLQAKGILTDEEVAKINQGSPADADQRLANLLLSKGIISQSDYDHAFGAAKVSSVSAAAASDAVVIPAVYRVSVSAPASAMPAANPAAPSPTSTTPSGAVPVPPDAPPVIPALTPLRNLPVGGLLREGLKPVFSIGSLHVAPYGAIKATFVHDSSSRAATTFRCRDLPPIPDPKAHRSFT